MSIDTDNNFLVSGASGNAEIATDFSPAEGAHFQVMKIAYGSTQDFNRVTASNGLPVEMVNSPTVTVSSVSNAVQTFGNMGVFGIAGATAIGVTAANFGIRSLTGGNLSSGTAHNGADFVRVIGASGAFPIGVTAANFGIRSLTGGNLSSGTAHNGADFVRVVGASGAFPVGITATALDIRGLTYTKDSMSVLNTVSVENGQSSPFSTTITQGFQTRLLRASTGGTPVSSDSALSPLVGSVEDTVRVVGISGAYPVATLAMGRTGSTHVPFKVDDSGNLFVNLAAGTIGVTANITSADFTLSGVSLAAAGTSAGAVSIHGYAGADANPVKVSATDLDIRNLSATDDSVNAVIRVLGASGDQVGITGSAMGVLTDFGAAIARVSSFNRVRTDDANAPIVIDRIEQTRDSAVKIQTAVESSFDSTNSSLRVNVVSINQPTGMTSGRVAANPSATTLGSFALKSGIHLKTDIGNSNTNPVFVGSAAMLSNNTNGFPLYNGDEIFIETDNANKVYFASASAGLTLYYVGT
jgi:predicted amino acid-binding ACT domain protein